jgi:polyisoprenoid-binding protein YceI
MIQRMTLTVVSLLLFISAFSVTPNLHAAEYRLDPEHSFVQFRIQHLGFSWLYGRFNKISGDFSHDAKNPQDNRISVQIDTASVDSNHAERDKHLRDERFLDVEKYPTASFKSTKYTGDDKGGVLQGQLNLHGINKQIDIEVKKLGEGADPWGGYRAGFIGTTTLTLKDFGITYNLGPAATTMELELGVEGIRK